MQRGSKTILRPPSTTVMPCAVQRLTFLFATRWKLHFFPRINAAREQFIGSFLFLRPVMISSHRVRVTLVHHHSLHRIHFFLDFIFH
jgi:hypothetical protein